MVGTALHWSYKAAGKLGVATRLLAPNRGDPTVLMYHGALSESGDAAERGDHKHVGESLFREHLSMLATHRRVVPLSQLVETLLAGGNCLGMVALTFDDGYLNNVECAARVLKEYSMSAAFFLATGFIGVERWVWTDRLEYIVEVAEPQDTTVSWRDGGGTQQVRFGSPDERTAFIKQMKAALKHLDWNIAESRVRELSAVLHVPQAPPHGKYRFMSWDHVRQLVKDGFEVGAHTVNHAILSRVPLKSAEEEILGSQARVREEAGTCCPVFCYPNGKSSDFTSEVKEICARYFAAALSAEPGHARREDRFELRRVSVDQSSSVDKLAARILEGGR